MRTIGQDASVQVITAAHPEWVFPFTGLQPAQFRKLVRLVAECGGDAVADGRLGRQWALDLADRVLLVAAYWRTNLTVRQIGPLFGVSHSAAHRVIDTLSLGAVTALSGGQHRRQRLAALLTREVQLRGQPAPRPSQRVIVGLVIDTTGRLDLQLATSTGACGVLMSPGTGGVDTDVPRDQPDGVGPCLQRGHHVTPDSGALPPAEQAVDGLPGPIQLGHVPPRQS